MHSDSVLHRQSCIPSSTRAIVNTHFLRVSTTTSVLEVIAQMNAQQTDWLDCALVMHETELVGILTAWDIVRLASSGLALDPLVVQDVMTHPVVSLPGSQLSDPLMAIALLQQNNIHHLPIVNDQNEPLGLVTQASIYRSLQPTNVLKLQQVSDLMVTQVTHARLTDSALILAQLMAEHQTSCVFIMDVEAEQRLSPVGLVTTRDLLQLHTQGQDWGSATAQTIMHASPLYLHPSDSLWLAQQEMQQRQVSHLAVIDEQGQLLGGVTQFDLLRALEPTKLYSSVRNLRQSVRVLETEKINLLHARNTELERLVQARTAQLEEQAKCDRLLTTMTLRIHQSLDLQEILSTTVSEVGQLLQTDRASIYRIDPTDQSGVIVVESVKPGWVSMLGRRVYDPCFAQYWSEAYQNGRIQAVEDIYKAGLSQCHIDLLAQFQVRANLVIPILRNQKLWGLLVAQHCAKPWRWRSWEVNLLKQLVKQVGIAIHQSDLYQAVQTELIERKRAELALQELNNDLEAKVEERTASWRRVADQLLIEISERNRIEKALQHAKDHLQAVIDAVPGLVSWVDKDSTYLGVNDHVAALCNLSPQDFIGREVGFFTQATEFGQFVEQFFANSVQTVDCEMPLTINGDGRHYLMVAQKYNQNQAAVFVGIDITERKQAEGERQQARTALHQSEAKFRNLVEQTNEWVWEVNHHLEFTYVNPRVQEISGYGADEILGKRIFDLMVDDEAVRLTTVLHCIVAQHERFSQLEATIIHKAGHPIVLEMSGVPVFDAAGHLQGYRGITRDITERKQIERDIRKALTKEKELNELKNRFISMASHEFRTPMTTILASAESLERYRHKWPEEKQIASLHRIRNSVNYMTRLLEDVLIMGKAEAGKLEYHATALNLDEFCMEILEELQLEASNANRLRFVSQGDRTPVEMDEKLLRHILINLLSNGLKYSPPDTSVHMTLTYEAEQVVFEVQDHGIGIPANDLKRLFESFHRAANVGNIPGTGLGLAIVKKSVQAHGGKITVVSTVGVGTTFTVFLPITQHRGS